MIKRKNVKKIISAPEEFWDKLDKVAQSELLSRDQLIIEVMQRHFNLQDLLLSKGSKQRGEK